MSRVIQYKNNVVHFIQIHQGKILFLMVFLLLAQGSFAEDALSAAEPTVKDTYNGSIKTYLYVGEAVAAIMTLIFTRNIKALGAVGGVAIFLNVVAALAGI
ncbi:fimbrial protein [Legionella pneumophila]|uniref:fimbrial protein n=1 Tax=Legionella pneumophila TaxID=446 RepID=UPI0022B47472|nr:fimbrial protein [Legionella pneumophila]MCZ4786716.1 fimbrial protein [Legionella pneumophila]